MTSGLLGGTWLTGWLPERRAAEYRLMIIWNELAICRRLPVTCQHARKNAGHEGSAANGSGCRMVRFAETAGKKEPRSFRVKFVVASCTWQIPGALSMGPVHVSVGTELNAVSFLYIVPECKLSCGVPAKVGTLR